MIPRLAVACVLLLLPGTVAAQHTAPDPAAPRRTYTTSPVATGAARAWRADVRHLVAALEDIHPDPYHRTSRETFAAAASALDARVGSLAAHEILVELARLLALVGDGHTSLPLYFAEGVDFRILPLRLGIYADGVFVEGADRAYADAVGGRVVAIGGVPIDSALARVLPLISRDNGHWLPLVAPHLLNRAEVLHALRLSDSLDSASFTLERDGRRRSVRVSVAPQLRPSGFGIPFLPRYTDTWIDARDTTTSPPLHQRRFDDVYWLERLPGRRLLYIAYNQVQNRAHGETAAQFFRRAMQFARDSAAGIDRVLLDLRNNTGGEGGLNDAVVREIVRTREIDERDRLFVAIGPRTFSAATLLAVQLERYSLATFAGQPTGGTPNIYAGHQFVRLPNSGVVVAVSPQLYQSSWPHDTRDAVYPRLAAAPTFADYVNNRDPVLEAVLEYEGDDAFSDDVAAALRTGHAARADSVVRAFEAAPVNRWFASTGVLNRFGYALLRGGDVARAVEVFELNVRVHPEYANGWDSLGEGRAAAGDRAGAIEAYERALVLDPSNSNAQEWLHRLRGS